MPTRLPADIIMDIRERGMNVYIVLGCFRDEGAHIVGIWDSQIDATRHRKELDDTKTYDYTELIPFEKNKRHEKTYYQERESV